MRASDRHPQPPGVLYAASHKPVAAGEVGVCGSKQAFLLLVTALMAPRGWAGMPTRYKELLPFRT